MYLHGISFEKKGWKVYTLKTDDIFVIRNVIFHEGVYPFAKNQAKWKGDLFELG